MQPYLYGYLHAVEDSADDQPETNPPFSRFNAWVAAKFDWYEPTAGWCRIILKESGGDDAAALDRFFNLVDEFQTARLIPIHHVETNSSHAPTGNVTVNGNTRQLPPSLTTLKYFPESRNCFLRYNYVDSPEERWSSNENKAFETARVEFGIALSEWSAAS